MRNECGSTAGVIEMRSFFFSIFFLQVHSLCSDDGTYDSPTTCRTDRTAAKPGVQSIIYFKETSIVNRQNPQLHILSYYIFNNFLFIVIIH